MHRDGCQPGRGLVWGVVFIGMWGCGAEQPVLVPVTGRVTLNDQPVGEVIVSFAPLESTPGSGAMGRTDAEGRFRLLDARGKPGSHVGNYKVHLYPAPIARSEGAPANVVSIGSGGVPPVYIDPNYTPLRANVPVGGGDIDIRLTPTGVGATTVTSAPRASGG